jgi:hypothetical protein
MGHDTTVRTILSWVCVRVGRVYVKNNAIRAWVPTAKNVTTFQNRELIQRLLVAFVGKL